MGASTDLILVLDQGTTGSKVLLLDKTCRIWGRAYQEITQHYPKPGWVEHDPEEIWTGMVALIGQVLSGIDVRRVKALALTNQRETIVVWDKTTGKPLAPAVVWQCRRSVDICKDLLEKGYNDLFRRKTGLKIDPYFSGTKVKWLLDQDRGLREKAAKGQVCIGTIDSWLLWNLTGGKVFATDYSNASRTLYYNIYECRWDQELLAILGIPPAALPEVYPSSYQYGTTVAVGQLPAGVPIAGVIGDSQAALFGEACFRPGMAKATYGTGTSLLMFVGEEPVSPPEGLVATLAWGLGNKPAYALEGVINITGATMQWLRDGLGILDDVTKSAEIARSLSGNDGVFLVPAFVGLGAPYWDMDARGLICGLTRSTTRAHLIRAGLESIAYQVFDAVELMQKSGIKLDFLRADGAAAANEFLMQFQADLLNVEVSRPALREVSALGAVYLAGLAVGLWRDTGEIAAAWQEEKRFKPQMGEGERAELIRQWKEAVQRALSRN
ncbi:MAG TPA: glycerol kinase GlpK [Firmicutes bacterium]|uniref:Glycerol kinase n=1 Tax=Capillibacterium thermochitinicola TaxID=2699427 RepID=A0A8J6LHI3_9FIRM|nr:glycerol kinase GlpK [Capillibacterium thermochitinicola]HHW11919.1 glycerol kinase GlpK [Bacillota bacterium]